MVSNPQEDFLMQHHVYRLIATDPLQTVKINTRTSALRPLRSVVSRIETDCYAQLT